MQKSIAIRHAWDGTPLAMSHWVTMDVTLDDSVMRLCVDAPYFDNPPPEEAPNPETGLWGLWDYEVVEIFLVGASGEYTEIEVGPHGHHLILRLDAPRSVVDKLHPMMWQSSIAGGRWQGEGTIERTLLPASIERFNAFAIRTVAGIRQYCCHHPLPSPQPDFHQPERFPKWQD